MSTGGAEEMRDGASLPLKQAALGLWAERQRRTELPILGRSMWPFLRSGGRIVVRHGGEAPRFGQVVVYLEESRTVAHRVVARRREGDRLMFLTKGDANLTFDPEWLVADRLAGVVEGVVSRTGVVRPAAIDGPLARLLAVLSAVQGVLLRPFRARRRSRRRAGGSGLAGGVS